MSKRNFVQPLESRRLLSASISGIIYQDIGATGSFHTGDPGLGGWAVYLIQNNNTLASTVTDASGRYTFSDVAAPGNYQIRENPVTGFAPIPDEYQDVTVADGQALANVDIGNQSLVNFTYPGLSSAQDAVNNSGATTPVNSPTSSIALSQKFLVTVNNNSITTYHREDGTEVTTNSLSYFFSLAQTPVPTYPNATNATDPEVFYTSASGKFFVVALDNNTTAGTSNILIAASQKAYPNDTIWHYHSIDVQATTGFAGDYASNLSVSFNGSAIYITADINKADGTFVASRLWLVNRGRAFGVSTNPLVVTAGTKYVFVYDPSSLAGAGADLSNFDAVNFSSKSTNGVDTAYLIDSTPTNPADIADVIKITNPGNKAKFSLFKIAAPAGLSAVSSPAATQPDDAPSIDTTTNPISATWRKNDFWIADTLTPSSGADAGTAQVYWFQYYLPGFSLRDSGAVSGSTISAGASTFAPSVSVDHDQYLALTFTASGPSLDPTEYAVSRRMPDPAGYLRAPLTIAAGTSAYSATTESSGLVDWGQNELTLDPADQERFWIMAHYPTDPASAAGPWSQTIVAFQIPPKKFPTKNT
ncbi:MAG TPA: SdrD B-like domain-containing protein [Tepidisphaeraceae bacterium]|jgi:hypothetical protein